MIRQIVHNNESGQVKINYTGLTLTGFTENVIRTFDINAATPTLVSSPTTMFPASTPKVYSGVFDNTRGTSPTGRLIENPIKGQVHVWRVQINYSSKPTNLALGLDIILTNPVSGFSYVIPFTLPESKASGQVNNIAFSIADNESIPSPRGYILQASVSKTDANFSISIASLTRISQAFN